MIAEYKILRKHGWQFIPDVFAVTLPESYQQGRPIITELSIANEILQKAVENCPTGALSGQADALQIDLGLCVFCGECQRICGSDKIKFTNDYQIATNARENLVVRQGQYQPIRLQPDKIRKEIRSYFGGSLKLRQISAGGDNSAEWELNACSNPNFDMGRFGIEFLASPRHCDGIVITGPISQNMAEATQICYDAVPNPKILVLAGNDAISGGIFAGSPALDRSFLDKYPIDLYVPGNPPHPLTFICGLLDLMRSRKK